MYKVKLFGFSLTQVTTIISLLHFSRYVKCTHMCSCTNPHTHLPRNLIVLYTYCFVICFFLFSIYCEHFPLMTQKEPPYL